MLKFLLDEQITHAVATGFRRHFSGIVIYALSELEDGRFLGSPDEIVLEEAAARGLTVVTYDLRTFPAVLKRWADIGRDHCGVVLIDEITIQADDIGALIRTLHKLHRDSSHWDWVNRVLFLRR